MPQPADFGGFFSVPAAICQRSPKPLHKVPRIANGLDAELLQNPPDLEDRILQIWMDYYTDH
jgi:hypothetical protein